MMRGRKKSSVCMLVLSMLLFFSMLNLPVGSVYAADPAEVGTEAELVTALTSGGNIKLTADISATAGLTVSTDTVLDVNGHTLTIAADPDSGAGFQVTDSSLTLTDSAGSGQIAITSSLWGMKFDGDSSKGLILKNVDLEITGATYVGLYSAAMGRPITMDGGKLLIQNCGTGTNGWGAVRWGHANADYGGPVAFNSGVIDIEDNGYNWFNFYVSHDVIFGDGGSAPLTVTLKNAATAGTGFENTLQLTQIYADHKGLTINKNATVNITLTGSAGQRRGINSDGAPVVIDGGVLNIDSEYTGSDNTYGLRGITASVVNGGTLNVSGTNYGVSKRGPAGSFDAEAGAFVTSAVLEGGMDSEETLNTITGGSVKMDDSCSIIDGIMAAIDPDKVDPVPVNAAGEELTRFDLKGKADTDIEIAAEAGNETAHPGYTYSVGKDHDGTAYVWAPAVSVNFWPNEEAYTGGNAEDIILTDYTIRGNTIPYVGGSSADESKLPVPAGKQFSHWVNADTGETFDPSADAVSADMDVYAVYTDKEYNIVYSFVSGTSNMSLPAEVTALLPGAAKATDHTAVTAAQPSASTVDVADGTWTFTGYDADSKTISGADITFTGTWTFKAAGTASVTDTGSIAKNVSNGTGIRTGDSSNINMYVIIAVIAAALVAVLLLVRKKRH